jgi:hypothetical protein
LRNSGAVGYKYITVDEDDAANVIYANGALLHLGSEQIPRGSAVSNLLLILFILPAISMLFNGSRDEEM